MMKITTSQNIHLLYLDLLDHLKKVSPLTLHRSSREPSWPGGAGGPGPSPGAGLGSPWGRDAGQRRPRGLKLFSRTVTPGRTGPCFGPWAIRLCAPLPLPRWCRSWQDTPQSWTSCRISWWTIVQKCQT